MRFITTVSILLFQFIALISYGQINLDSGLVGHFMLDGNTADSSSTLINGVSYNFGYTTGVNGIGNTAGSFNGYSTYVSAGANNRNITSQLTVCAWVKTSTNGRVIEKYRWQDDKGFLIGISPAGKARLAGRNGANSYVTTANTGPTITDNEWHFLLGIINGNSWEIWVDDSLIDNTLSSSSVPQLNNINPLIIGKYYSSNNTYFNGDIDKVRLYNRVLSVAERTKLYEDGLWTIDTIVVNTCDSFLWSSNGPSYNQTGVYSDTLVGANGFDSISVLDLTIVHSTDSSITEVNCGSYTAPDSNVYSTSGIYTATIPNSVGCDSVITINLIINQSSTYTTTEVVCDSYLAPDGQVYNSTGVYQVTLTNSAGCDSVVTINLTVNHSDNDTINEIACNSYTAPDGQVYTVSGVYTANLQNVAGCDSIVTINLTINSPSSAIITQFACDSFAAPDGQFYYSSGVYTAVIPNSVGCDSVLTINLTIGHPTMTSITEVTCGSYIAPDGQVYSASGIYTSVIPNSIGCDSIITINLTIIQPSTSSITTTSCGPYTAPDGTVLTVTGNYTAIIPNSTGCDSVISIDLTVSDIDTSLTLNENQIDAVDDSSYSYQWIDCGLNVAIPGEINSSFEASQSGNYQVIIANGNCVDTSNCVNVIVNGISNEYLSDVKLYPNPAKRYVSISGLESGMVVSLLSTDGKLILRKSVFGNDLNLELNTVGSGYYLVELRSKKFVKRLKLIVE